MIDMNSVFEFELLVRWVPKEPEAVCSDVRLLSMNLLQLSHVKQVKVSLLSRVALSLFPLLPRVVLTLLILYRVAPPDNHR